jgi:peptidoglycan/xylan/chitin deacetylase (PgdA/CDA1 family)
MATWKKIARFALHNLGGLSVLRWSNRRKSSILMFHSFSASTQSNLNTICAHIARSFEPITLSQITASFKSGSDLPKNAVAITIDDGYKTFFDHAFPIFHAHKIPTTLYVVSGFAAGKLWLWFDQVEFVTRQTKRTAVRVSLNGKVIDLPLRTEEERIASCGCLIAALKEIPNQERLRFIDQLGSTFETDIPPQAPQPWSPMNWDDLRAAAADGVEIGCHSDTHPILSQVSDPVELKREIWGAKCLLEQHLCRPIRHFCYPNGREVDISEQARNQVLEAGFNSAVTTTWGQNSRDANPMNLKRVPFDHDIDYRYGTELLGGLHL